MYVLSLNYPRTMELTELERASHDTYNADAFSSANNDDNLLSFIVLKLMHRSRELKYLTFGERFARKASHKTLSPVSLSQSLETFKFSEMKQEKYELRLRPVEHEECGFSPHCLQSSEICGVINLALSGPSLSCL